VSPRPAAVQVAVPVPFLPPLTYSVPDDVTLPAPGCRVLVPLGNRVVTGCVVPSVDTAHRSDEVATPSGGPTTELRDVLDVVDQQPLLPLSVLQLALWVAEYYACGVGDAVAAAMPPFAWVRQGRRHARQTAFKTARFVHLTVEGRQLLEERQAAGLGARQGDALRLLSTASDGCSVRGLSEHNINPDTLRRLVARRLVRFEERRVERDPFDTSELAEAVEEASTSTLSLTADQQRALDQLTPLAVASQFKVALLHGVTGSGKTELYRRLAATVCGGGRRALVLVPEIALAPAVARTFRAVFGQRVAIQHSGLSDGERHDQWHRIRQGEVDIVVGTRSAVFAPLDNIGLVIVDEEHDSSYKQEESPRYHGRDAAIIRGRDANALVVLGSATPSMETYHNAVTGRYALATLSARVWDRPLPDVQVVDMRDVMAAEGADAVISTTLLEALEKRLHTGEQSLLLLNRRGFAAAVLCRQCGQALECPNCSVTLTFHRAAGRLRCHYCNYARARPRVCPHCAGPYLERVGFGTERIETEVKRACPEARVARLDRDTVTKKGAAAQLLGRFGRGDIDVLVGTQMIAKGHDFPSVTLVGVISADVGLGLADFRAAERTYQLLTQVAGRAGRGDRRGEAIIQTFYPEHYSIGYACRQVFTPFFEAEMRFRRGMKYPPVVAMVNAIVRGPKFDEAMREASGLVHELRTTRQFEVLGPAPAPLRRVRGEYRVQFFLKGTHRPVMRQALQDVVARHPALQRRVTIDVDPLSVL